MPPPPPPGGSIAGTNLQWVGKLDLYRKVPTDLLEGTRRGSILSYCAVFIMVTLFLLETSAFFEKRLVTNLQLDINEEKKVRLNFNITMMDLKCEFCVVDVVSVLGTEQNVSSHITKWHVDAAGVRQRYQGRNKQQRDIDLFDPTVKESLDELHDNGEDAIHLTEETFEYALKTQEYLFVDFYASWCSHCRDLAPTWETLAEVMTAVAEHLVDQTEHNYSDHDYEEATKLQLPVMVTKVDCVQHHLFCQEQMIFAYPTLRLFVDGKPWRGGDYNGHRTVLDMVEYLKAIEETHKSETQNDSRNLEIAHQAAKSRIDSEELSDEENEWAENVRKHRQRMHHSWVEANHPGCQLSGHLLLDRVPGNFHIQARSPHHDLVPHLTNVSHVIHSLSIGEPVAKRLIEHGAEQGTVKVPPSFVDKINPMDNNVYINFDLHEAYHHYLKVVTTNIEGLRMGKRELKAYQIIQSSQLAYYRTDIVPEAKFIFDLSPIAVSYSSESRRWYDYITSIFAIIGGTFTAIGILENAIARAVSTRKRY